MKAIMYLGAGLIGFITSLLGVGYFMPGKTFALNPIGIILNLALCNFWVLICHYIEDRQKRD
jgi:hypothetical protein